MNTQSASCKCLVRKSPPSAFRGHDLPDRLFAKCWIRENGRRTCAALALRVADRIAGQLAAGDRLLAILGGNLRSPGCAVHGEGNDVQADSGVFIQELQRELSRRGLAPPFRGIRDARPELQAEDLLWLRQLISRD